MCSKFLLLNIIIILFNASLLKAQRETRSASGSATANLIMPLSISSSSSNLDFGEIILTNSSFNQTIDPFQGLYFTVTGQPGRNVSVNFSTIQLSNSNWVSTFGGQLGTLQFTPNVKLDNGTTVISGNLYNLVTESGLGKLYLRVGGTVNIASNQPHGDYQGIFTITVSY